MHTQRNCRFDRQGCSAASGAGDPGNSRSERDRTAGNVECGWGREQELPDSRVEECAIPHRRAKYIQPSAASRSYSHVERCHTVWQYRLQDWITNVPGSDASEFLKASGPSVSPADPAPSNCNSHVTS